MAATNSMHSGGVGAERIRRAASRIAAFLDRTPLEIAAGFRAPGGSRVRWKLECFQATGSFKARGALNRLLVLRETAGERVLRDGVVTASSGNHGRATAWALARLGGRGIVYLPETVADAKREALRQYGEVVEVRLAGEDAVESEAAARAESERSGRPFISPYNDPEVIAGQGSIGVEIHEAMGDAELGQVVVPVGGGGLIGGIAAFLQEVRSGVRIVGCQPRASAVMAASVSAGRILDSGTEVPFLPTLADGVAGGVEAGAITFDPCRRVDQWVLLEEAEIAEAMRLFLARRFALVEGSGALPIAALPHLAPAAGETVLVLSGAGISAAGLRMLARNPPPRGASGP